MTSSRYLSARAVGIARTNQIGDLLDKATHPLTQCEIMETTGQPYSVIYGFLRKNDTAGRISSRPIPRPNGGKP